MKEVNVNCNCNFQVGDLVDWHRYSWRLRRHTTQKAYWHGAVVADLGTQKLGAVTGHVLKVEWTKSNWWGKSFTKEPEGTVFVANGPVHVQTEICIELEHCDGPGTSLHPRSLG